MYHTLNLVAVTHHYFTLDSLLGFLVWSFLGWIFCAVLLVYYEQERGYNGEKEKEKAKDKWLVRTVLKCSVVGGLIIGVVWFIYHSSAL